MSKSSFSGYGFPVVLLGMDLYNYLKSVFAGTPKPEELGIWLVIGSLCYMMFNIHFLFDEGDSAKAAWQDRQQLPFAAVLVLPLAAFALDVALINTIAPQKSDLMAISALMICFGFWMDKKAGHFLGRRFLPLKKKSEDKS